MRKILRSSGAAREFRRLLVSRGPTQSMFHVEHSSTVPGDREPGADPPPWEV